MSPPHRYSIFPVANRGAVQLCLALGSNEREDDEDDEDMTSELVTRSGNQVPSHYIHNNIHILWAEYAR